MDDTNKIRQTKSAKFNESQQQIEVEQEEDQIELTVTKNTTREQHQTEPETEREPVNSAPVEQLEATRRTEPQTRAQSKPKLRREMKSLNESKGWSKDWRETADELKQQRDSQANHAWFDATPIAPNERIIAYASAAQQDIDEPRTWQEAMSSTQQHKWQEAADKEHNSLWTKGVMTLTVRPADRHVIGSKTTFKIKRNQNGQIEKFKVRVCARGDAQEFGKDYHETFAPVAKHSTLRLMLATSAIEDLEFETIDISTAYLNANNDTEVLMTIPDGMKLNTRHLESNTTPDERTQIEQIIKVFGKPIEENTFQVTAELKKRIVLRLNKALYGLKQAGRQWNERLNSILTESLKFTRSKADPCLYNRHSDGHKLWTVVYVDDIAEFATHKAAIEKFEHELKQHVEITKQSPEWLLGIHIQRNKAAGTITLSQSQYVENILCRYGLQQMKPQTTPAQPGDHLEVVEETDQRLTADEKYLYQQLVGSLLYIAICTRPDIADAVRNVATQTSEPTTKHLTAAKRILRYLKHTQDTNLTYQRESKNQIVGYVDASWGENKNTRKSTTGFVFCYARGAIAWKSKTQPTIALSSCEAEYMALTLAIQEATHILQTIGSAEIPTQSSVIYLLEDNQAAIALASNPTTTSRTKHIDIKLHFIREVIKRGKIIIKHCPTDKQVADLLTKSLSRTKFEQLKLQILGITAHDFVLVHETTNIPA
jgi:hypothetical protein